MLYKEVKALFNDASERDLYWTDVWMKDSHNINAQQKSVEAGSEAMAYYRVLQLIVKNQASEDND